MSDLESPKTTTDDRRQTAEKSLRIAWAPFAHPDAPMGYGVIASKLREALTSAGADMLPSTAFGWDCVVAVSLPAAWPSGQHGRREDLVWHTMFELEPLPRGWAEALNRSAAVWVPSPWCKDLFEAHGVTVPVFASGYGVDGSIFYPIDRTTDPSGLSPQGRSHRPLAAERRPYRVLVWSQALVGRKNALMALRAFLDCGFAADEAEIEIKVNADYGAEGIKGPDGNWLPNARVIAANWPASQVADWLRSGDVLVYLSGGEGFGLMPLEAMATGLPVVCADNTGMRDYLTSENALLVPSTGKRKSVSYSLRFGVDCYEEMPDQDAARDWLRWCFEHREEAYRIGRRGAETAAALTWQKAGERALAQLTEIFGGRRGDALPQGRLRSEENLSAVRRPNFTEVQQHGN